MRKTVYSERKTCRGIRLAALILLATVLCTALVGCRTGQVDGEGYATLVVAAGEDVREYSVPLSEVEKDKGAVGLLDYLEAEGELEYTSEGGGYGEYLTSVGQLKEDAASGVYIGIWTSVEKDMDRESTYSTTLTYKGTELVSSAVSMTQLSVPDGAIIYIGELVYR